MLSRNERCKLSSDLARYFERLTKSLPEEMTSLHSSRLVVLFLGTVGADILSECNTLPASDLTAWVYSHQITVNSDAKDKTFGGFRSLLYTKNATCCDSAKSYDASHITMVYTALSTLLTLNDGLQGVDRSHILPGISALQCSDEPGLFKAGFVCHERDMRFVFSAVASCYILDGLYALDKEAIVGFIGRSLTHDGGFGCLPGLEAHAGATYCAVASLALLDRLDSFLPPGSRPRDRLIKWLLSLQSEGLHGRLHKPDDTCYTFWVCASLKLLRCEDLINRDAVILFVARSWDPHSGGIRKYPDPSYPPDPLHTFLALSGLACLKSVDTVHTTQQDNTFTPNGASDDPLSKATAAFHWLLENVLQPVHPALNISQRAFERLRELHLSWKRSPSTHSVL
ncbi:unnamed protein product [Dicrocoelium dendriticum]|nr:unnamed protein product [Dicrocoelium dendriticum]